MHVKSVRWFIDCVRYGILMAIIVLHVAMVRNQTYTVNFPVTRTDGAASLVRVAGLTEEKYDSLLLSVPPGHNRRSLIECSRQTFYFNRIPGRVLNIIYCVYIYYIVVAVIRTIMYVRRRTRD